MAGSFTEEFTAAVSADRMWKLTVTGAKSGVMVKACAGFVDAVEADGEGLGSITTLKFNPAVTGGEELVVKNKIVAFDDAARTMRSETLEGGKLRSQLKSQVSEVKMVPTGEGSCVVKVTVEYERLDGAPLSAEDKAHLVQGYLGLTKHAEAYLIAHPEFA